jgi:hypothetical protein
MPIRPLDSSLAKVRRAYRNIRQFERETETAPDGEMPLMCLAKTFDATDSAYVLTLAELRPIPLRTLLLLDEAVHHLRSALDHVLFAVALADSGEEQASTQFPLLSSPDDWGKPPRGDYTQRRLLAGVSDAHREAIEKRQPYHPWTFRGTSFPHPLKVLNDLSNDNKHRFVQEAFVTFQSFRVTPGIETNCRFDDSRALAGFLPDPRIIGEPLQPDRELARVPVVVLGADHDLELQIQSHLYIGFRDGIGCANLRQSAAYIRAIISEFAPVLGDPKTLELWETVEGRFKVTPKKTIIIARSIPDGA